MSLQTIDGRLTIVGVTAASPAYEQGLNVNDEILALDGFRVTQDSLARRISERPPGSRVEMLLARGGRIRTAPLVLGIKDSTDRNIVRVESPTDEQKRFYEHWLSTPW